MEWLNAAEKFLENYKDEDYFLGAIVTGSYVSGNNDEASDVDVFIVTKDESTWRERGNKLIDGYLIEYFINPKRKIVAEMEEGLINYRTSTANIFANSKILYDKDGTIKELVDMGVRYKNPEMFEPVDQTKFKMNSYSIWDCYDELTNKYRKKLNIEFTYNIFLNKVIDAYFYAKQIPGFPINKLDIILTNEEFRRKYKILKMPSQEFVDLLLACLNAKEDDKKMLAATNIYNYYFKEVDDFDINNFSLRTEV